MVMALIRIQNIPVYYLTPSTTCSYHSFLFCLFLASVRFCVVERLVPVLPLISILSAEKHDNNLSRARTNKYQAPLWNALNWNVINVRHDSS